jgi:hypothetical protein
VPGDDEVPEARRLESVSPDRQAGGGMTTKKLKDTLIEFAEGWDLDTPPKKLREKLGQILNVLHEDDDDTETNENDSDAKSPFMIVKIKGVISRDTGWIEEGDLTDERLNLLNRQLRTALAGFKFDEDDVENLFFRDEDIEFGPVRFVVGKPRDEGELPANLDPDRMDTRS